MTATRWQVLAAVVRHVDWAVVRCLVIAGPGFAKDAFRAHLEAEAVRRELRCACPSGMFFGMHRYKVEDWRLCVTSCRCFTACHLRCWLATCRLCNSAFSPECDATLRPAPLLQLY